MGPANALSQKDEVETCDDNQEITLLKGKDQCFHLQAIDCTLMDKISSSSAMDPIVIKALAAMNDTSGEPWIPHTNKADWEFIDNALYFKHKWSMLLPMAEFAHNSATHSVTQKTPFSLMMGYEPWAYPSLGKTFLPNLESWLVDLSAAHDDAQAAHKIAQQKMKEWITSKCTPWKVGITVEGPPIPFSPFSLADCTLLNHFSFNDFVAIAFPDIARDLDIQI